SLEARTAYSAEACMWVTTELAIAVGLATADPHTQQTQPSQRYDVRGKLPHRSVHDGTEHPAAAAYAPTALGDPEPARPAHNAPVRRRRRSFAAAVSLLVLVAAGGSIALYYARRPADGAPRKVPHVSIGSFSGREPTVIDFSADGASAVTGIEWSTWTG